MQNSNRVIDRFHLVMDAVQHMRLSFSMAYYKSRKSFIFRARAPQNKINPLFQFMQFNCNMFITFVFI